MLDDVDCEDDVEEVDRLVDDDVELVD